jgi:hypothetical protein
MDKHRLLSSLTTDLSPLTTTVEEALMHVPPSRTPRRRGTALIEGAIVFTTTFVLLFGIIVGGLGVFRHQQVATLAREGARYASVHGGQYREEAGLPVGTADDWKADIYQNGLVPYMVGLDPGRLSYTVEWSHGDNYPLRVTTDNGQAEINLVTVTVTYNWLPEVFLVGPITMTSTSRVPMAY